MLFQSPEGTSFSPSITGLSDGGFVVLHESLGLDGSAYGVFGHIFESNGNLRQSIFQVNQTTESFQSGGRATALPDGGFAVTWHSRNVDFSSYAVLIRTYNANGIPQTPETRLNQYRSDRQADPAIATLADGRLIVVWESEGQDGSDKGVYGRFVSAAGVPQGAEFLINTRTTDDQRNPTVAATLDGGFLVAWDNILTRDTADIRFQLFDGFGNRIGDEGILGADVPNQNVAPAIDIGEDGVGVITWLNVERGADAFNVFAAFTGRTIVGDGDSNSLTGTMANDVIDGFGGNDTIIGGAGNDTILGGDGQDSLDGGAGDDQLIGGADSDLLNYSSGSDLLSSDGGNDVIVLSGSDYHTANHVAFNVSSDTQVGTQARISLTGQVRIEAVTNGGADADIIQLSDEGDAFFLHDAFSRFHNSVALTEDYLGKESAARFVNIEEIRGMGGDDIIDLTSPNYSLAGVAMSIDGGKGHDVIWGSDANENISGGNGNDTIFGGIGTNVLTGGGGADVFEFTRTSTDTSVTDFDITEDDALRFYNTGGAEFDASSAALTSHGIQMSYTDTVSGTVHDLSIDLATDAAAFTATLSEILNALEVL